ncbi:MAG: hypothetical protein ACREI3_10800 [Nitrospirales bacterium]
MKTSMGIVMALVLGISTLALAVFAATSTNASSSPPRSPVQYRTLYLSSPPPPSLLQAKLEEYGQEGWELVAVIPQSGLFIFKQ